MAIESACPADPVLIDLLTGRLGLAAGPLEDHFLACERCRAALDALSPPDDLLNALRVSAERAAGVEPAAVERLMERLRRVPAETPWGDAAGAIRTDLPVEGWSVASYRIEGLLGEGGMGRVYRAFDETLRRPVALKMMKPAVAVRPDARDRFLHEARAVAALHDDHIAAIYHVGEAPDLGGETRMPFLVMPLLRGESLDGYARRSAPLPEAEVRAIGRQIALGLAAAHTAGLVHRDVKPANVWLETGGEALAPGNYRVKLLDFGLALAAEQPDESAGLVGTPGYMAPEQAGGKEVDHRADLFALGCVLYRLSTGRHPFDGSGLTERLRATREKDAPPVRSINPAVSPPLAGLIAALMRKEPAGRPSISEVLAVLGRPTPRSRRAVLVAGAVVLLGLAGLGLWFVLRAGPVPSAAVNPSEAEAAWASLDARLRADRRGGTELFWRQWRTELQAFRARWASTPSAAEAFERLASIPTPLDLAGQVSGEPAGVVARLGDARMAHWNMVSGVAFHPRRNRIASCGWDGTVTVWDAETGRQVRSFDIGQWVDNLAYSPTGECLAAGGRDGRVLVWEADGGKELARLGDGEASSWPQVAFHPDGVALAFTAHKDHSIRVWDLAAKAERSCLGPNLHRAAVYRLAFSPDGGRIAAATDDGFVRVWDSKTGAPQLTLTGHVGDVTGLAFSPDGRRVATTGNDRTVRIWDAASGKQIARRDSPGVTRAVVWLPGQGALAFTCFDRTVQVWDGGNASRTVASGTDAAQAFAVDPAGTRLATGGHDGLVRLWDASGKGELFGASGRGGTVRAVAVDVHGMIAVGSGDGDVRLWSVPTDTPDRPDRMLRGHTRAVVAAAFTPDGQALLTASWDGTVREWDVATGKETHAMRDHVGSVHALALTPDGGHVISGGKDGRLLVWDRATREVTELGDHGAEVNGLAVTPDGRFVAVADGNSTVVAGGKGLTLWDLGTRKALPTGRGQGNVLASVAVRPDGGLIAFGGFWPDATVRVIAPESSGEPRKLFDNASAVRAVAFDPTGRWLAAVGEDGRLRLWDAAGTSERVSLKLAPGSAAAAVAAVAFAPNGRHVVTGNGDGTVTVFRVSDLIEGAAPPR